jgi:hypothetical protein
MSHIVYNLILTVHLLDSVSSIHDVQLSMSPVKYETLELCRTAGMKIDPEPIVKDVSKALMGAQANWVLTCEDEIVPDEKK